MAAALSRALKLPGKKVSELGEYDPLTQADSEDESEEDDLVLNYPRNGFGRDRSSSKLRNSRPVRLVDDQALEEEEEEEEEDDEWREDVSSKSRLDRSEVKGEQYWSHRESGRQRMEDVRGGGGGGAGGGRGGGSGALGVHGAEAEKRMRKKQTVRTAFFLVPLIFAALLVPLCAFLIPCRKRELEMKLQWERALGEAGGVTPPALALWDVDEDAVDDVFLGVTAWTNESHTIQGSKIYSAVALSAAGGHVLWRKVMRESVMSIQCGLQFGAPPSAVCLLVCKSLIMAVNATTGRRLWTVLLKNIESQVVLLPDLQGDSIPDLLVATLPADAALDLSLNFISGLTGATLGHPVPYNLTAQGKLIGPLLHETKQGAYYILFGLGNVEAISVRDIYIQAMGKTPLTQALRRRDPSWEGLKKTNSTPFVHIYRGSEHVEFLLPLVVGFGNNRNSLDGVSNLNSSRSDWAIVYGSSKVSVIRQRDLRKEWTFNSAPINTQPAPGHFNNDGVPDIFSQHSANGVMKAQIVDGASGRLLWSAEFVCPRLHLDTAAISTSTGQSAFLFWASDPIGAQGVVAKTTVAPDVAAAEPLIRKLFLLHPTYPTILLELNNTTDTAVTSAVSYLEQQRDATYITVSSRPTPDSEPGARIIKSMSLRNAVSKGKIVELKENSSSSSSVVEINKFFRRLHFRRQ